MFRGKVARRLFAQLLLLQLCASVGAAEVYDLTPASDSHLVVRGQNDTVGSAVVEVCRLR